MKKLFIVAATVSLFSAPSCDIGEDADSTTRLDLCLSLADSYCGKADALGCNWTDCNSYNTDGCRSLFDGTCEADDSEKELFLDEIPNDWIDTKSTCDSLESIDAALENSVLKMAAAKCGTSEETGDTDTEVGDSDSEETGDTDTEVGDSDSEETGDTDTEEVGDTEEDSDEVGDSDSEETGTDTEEVGDTGEDSDEVGDSDSEKTGTDTEEVDDTEEDTDTVEYETETETEDMTIGEYCTELITDICIKLTELECEDIALQDCVDGLFASGTIEVTETCICTDPGSEEIPDDELKLYFEYYSLLIRDADSCTVFGYE